MYMYSVGLGIGQQKLIAGHDQALFHSLYRGRIQIIKISSVTCHSLLMPFIPTSTVLRILEC